MIAHLHLKGAITKRVNGVLPLQVCFASPVLEAGPAQEERYSRKRLCRRRQARSESLPADATGTGRELTKTRSSSALLDGLSLRPKTGAEKRID
jgi:hypothetical protein